MARSSLTHRPSVARTRHALRPRLDPLEGRLLLAAGDLDIMTFNSPKGFVLTNLTAKGSADGEGHDVLIQQDGKVVVAGASSE